MWGQVRVVEPGSGLWSLPVCLDVRTSVSGDWGMGRGCGQRTKKVCAAQKRSELRPGGLFVVVSVRVRGEYIYTFNLIDLSPAASCYPSAHPGCGDNRPETHPEGENPTSHAHNNAITLTEPTHNGVTPWRHRQFGSDE